jgi:hypothetical protein
VQDWTSSLPQAIPRQTQDRLIHGSIGRFALFARFVLFVVQTPTA